MPVNGAAETTFKFSLTDESRSDSQGQGNVHHHGFTKKPKNVICLSDGLFFHLQGVWGNRTKSFVAVGLCLRGNPKIIKFRMGYRRALIRKAVQFQRD